MNQVVIVTDEFDHTVVLDDLDITITRNTSADVRYMHEIPSSLYERFIESSGCL